jgi:hypothetical protein
MDQRNGYVILSMDDIISYNIEENSTNHYGFYKPVYEVTSFEIVMNPYKNIRFVNFIKDRLEKTFNTNIGEMYLKKDICFDLLLISEDFSNVIDFKNIMLYSINYDISEEMIVSFRLDYLDRKCDKNSVLEAYPFLPYCFRKGKIKRFLEDV